MLNSSFAEFFDADSSLNRARRRAAHTIQFSIIGVTGYAVGPDPQKVEVSQGLSGRRVVRLHLNRTASGQPLVGRLLFKHSRKVICEISRISAKDFFSASTVSLHFYFSMCLRLLKQYHHRDSLSFCEVDLVLENRAVCPVVRTGHLV